MERDFKSALCRCGVISICRRVKTEQLLLLSDVLADAGILCMEVPFDQEDPHRLEKGAEQIRLLKQRHGELEIGAGTVLSKEEVRCTKEAGGSFIVSPNTNAQIVRYTKELGLSSVPGAMTPTEIVTAYEAGADAVKLFPAGYLGVGYVKDLTAPLGHIPLVATAGITLENFADFLRAGCCGAGIGSAIADRKLLEAGDRAGLLANAKAFVRIFEENKK